MYCIRKYFFMWDVQAQEKKWYAKAAKTKEYSILGTYKCSKLTTYTDLYTLSGEFNFEISWLRYCKTLS